MPGKPAAGGAARTRSRRKPLPGEEHLVRRKGTDAWHYDFQIDGARFRGSCGTAALEAAAAYAAARHDEEFRRIRLGEQPTRDLTLNDAFVRFYDEAAKGTSYGERGRKHQMARMLRLMGSDVLLADLSDALVNDLVQLLRTTPLSDTGRRATKVAGPATVNRYLDTLSAICRRAREVWGVRTGEWSRGKHRMKEPPPKARYLERDDARAVLREAAPHLVPLIALDLMTGMRKANVVRLTWEQVSLDLARVVVVGKGGKVLGIPLTPDAVKVLARLQPDPAARTGAVFRYGNPHVGCPCPACTNPRLGHIGQPFSNPKKGISRAFARAGLVGARFHDLRHTFASWLLEASGDLRMVKDALGHAEIETTMRYAHLVSGRQESVTAQATRGLLDAPAPARVQIEDDGEEKVA
jgi:integrase